MNTNPTVPYRPPSDGLRCPYTLIKGQCLTFISEVPGVVMIDMDDASTAVWELPPCQPIEIDDVNVPGGKRTLFVACFSWQDDDELEVAVEIALRSVGFRSEMLMSGPYDVEWFGVVVGNSYSVAPYTFKDTTVSRHVAPLM